MKFIFIDFETFWSSTHSLSKMSAIEYVMHEDTELISCAYAIGDDPVHVILGEEEIERWAAAVDWSDACVVGHNLSGFDSLILAWRLGVQPKLWACTLAMAAPIHQRDVGGSLKALVQYYKLGVKDAQALTDTKGRHLADFTIAERQAMKDYNKADTEQCRALFYKLLPHTPPSEMKLIDMTIRMMTEPVFEADLNLMRATLEEERARKRDMLLDVAETLGIETNGASDDAIISVVGSTLASANKFAKLLRTLGVEVPMKPSPSNPDKEVPALAKTDQAFIDLQEHEDVRVAAAAAARLGVKSTILESRLQTMLNIANVCMGRMPVTLKYHAATTGRWGGCLVADTAVICMTEQLEVATKRITDVLMSDFVWDGEFFVHHDGVAFSGYAEVVSYDGVTGTEDHKVYANGKEISLLEAMQGAHPIETCRSPTDDDVDAARVYVRHYQRQTKVPVRLRRGEVDQG